MKISLPAFIPGIAWFAVATFLFLIPGEDLPPEDLFKLPNIDKLVHTLLFFVLCYLFFRPFNKYANVAQKRSIYIKICMAAVVYGLLIEVMQKFFVTNRSFDLWDLLFDALGCLVAYQFARKFLLK